MPVASEDEKRDKVSALSGPSPRALLLAEDPLLVGASGKAGSNGLSNRRRASTSDSFILKKVSKSVRFPLIT